MTKRFACQAIQCLPGYYENTDEFGIRTCSAKNTDYCSALNKYYDSNVKECLDYDEEHCGSHVCDAKYMHAEEVACIKIENNVFSCSAVKCDAGYYLKEKNNIATCYEINDEYCNSQNKYYNATKKDCFEYDIFNCGAKNNNCYNLMGIKDVRCVHSNGGYYCSALSCSNGYYLRPTRKSSAQCSLRDENPEMVEGSLSNNVAYDENVLVMDDDEHMDSAEAIDVESANADAVAVSDEAMEEVSVSDVYEDDTGCIYECIMNDNYNCGKEGKSCICEVNDENCIKNNNGMLDGFCVIRQGESSYESQCIATKCSLGYYLDPKTYTCKSVDEYNCGEYNKNCLNNEGWQSATCTIANESAAVCVLDSCKKGYYLDLENRTCRKNDNDNCGLKNRNCSSHPTAHFCDLNEGECVEKCSAETSECSTLLDSSNGLYQYFCANTNNSVDHCGQCSNSCDANKSIDHAKMACQSGSCVLDGCEPGYHLFNDSCEADSNTNCGAHGNACLHADDDEVTCTSHARAPESGMEQSVPDNLQYAGDHVAHVEDRFCKITLSETCVNGKCVVIGLEGKYKDYAKDQVIIEVAEKVDDAPDAAMEMEKAHP
ncbi:MAG: hypothetical protein IIY06_02325 [Proteobacteria bacterium]|nr:hypothetical protein [Pseudomonadota bacterium]